MSAPSHPGAIDVNGLPYLRDAKGSLVPLSAVKPADLLMDETVRSILEDARAVSKLIADFKIRTFERVGDLQALFLQNYGATVGGANAKAEQDEIKTAALKGAFLPRDGVVDAVQGAFARVRAKLLALPSKCAPAISAMKSPVAIQEKLTELVHEALAELAGTVVGGQPISDDGVAPGDERGDRGSGEDLVAGICTTAAPDGEPVGGSAPQAKPRSKRRARPVGHEPG